MQSVGIGNDIMNDLPHRNWIKRILCYVGIHWHSGNHRLVWLNGGLIQRCCKCGKILQKGKFRPYLFQRKFIND